MESLKISEIKSVEQIKSYLNKSAINCNSAYYYMEDEYSSDPVIRKIEDHEINNQMQYSFELTPWGWKWKNKDDVMSVAEMAQDILEIIKKDYQYDN